MQEQQQTAEETVWFSTYGIITVNRVLDRYNIHLNKAEVEQVLKLPDHFYHRLLRIPLKNIYNGIILQQAKEYQVYLQKCFVDYLVSGENGKGEDSPGASIRDDIEVQRQALIKLNEQVDELTFAHDTLIAESQAYQIEEAGRWKQAVKKSVKAIDKGFSAKKLKLPSELINKAVERILIQYALDDLSNTIRWDGIEAILTMKLREDHQQIVIQEMQTLAQFVQDTETVSQGFLTRIEAMSVDLTQLRKHLYNMIIRIVELLNQLPDFKIDEQQTEINREDLYFDTDLESGGG